MGAAARRPGWWRGFHDDTCDGQRGGSRRFLRQLQGGHGKAITTVPQRGLAGDTGSFLSVSGGRPFWGTRS